ncbi:uncharacterized protein LOC144746094 [Ciona intestinalis]
MAKLNCVPSWVQATKREAQRSDAWLSFSKDIFDIVAGHMYDNGIRNFSSLSPAEKNVLVGKAVSLLKHQPTYKELLEDVSTALDAQLTKELKSKGIENDVKADAITKECGLALEVLLRQRPDATVHLRQCLNSTLSPNLRYLMWNLCIKNHKLEDHYKNVVAKSPKLLVSHLDYDISQKCNFLLRSNVTLKSLEAMKAAQSVMRHLMSYYHAKSKAKSALSEVYYFLAVPFVYCVLSKFIKPSSRSDPQILTTEDLAKLVSQYEQFITQTYAELVGNDNQNSDIYAQIGLLLRKEEPALASTIADAYTAETNVRTNVITVSCEALFRPMLKPLFVGYLDLETVMFIWDQIISCQDVQQYTPVPMLATCLILLAQDSLRDALTWRQIKSNFNSKLTSITPNQLISMMNDRGFTKQLNNEMDTQSRTNAHAFFASNSSALNALPPWRVWYSEKLVEYFKLNNSTTVQWKEGIGDDERKLESATGKTDLKELQLEKERLLDELSSMRHELHKATSTIDEEKRLRMEIQDVADAKIERLQLKLSSMQPAVSMVPLLQNLGLTEPKWEGSEVSSLADDLPVPSRQLSIEPTVNTDGLPISDEGDISHDEPENEENTEPDQSISVAATPETIDPSLDIMRGLVGRIMRGFNDLAHGPNDELANLNDKTVMDLQNVRKAYEKAKVQVFGRPISDEEIDQLNTKQKEGLQIKLSEATKNQLYKLNTN